jgi:hypothetical protein
MGLRPSEAVKKSTISRKDAKAQRLAKKNCLVFFAPSAALRLCVKCFSFSANYFTASGAWETVAASCGLTPPAGDGIE